MSRTSGRLMWLKEYASDFERWDFYQGMQIADEQYPSTRPRFHKLWGKREEWKWKERFGELLSSTVVCYTCFSQSTPPPPPYFHLKSPSLTHPLSLSRSSRLQMCRGSSVADIYSKSASEGSSICGALIERAPPLCGKFGRWRSREGLWTALTRRRNQKPGAKEHFQKASEGKLCTTKQQKSLANWTWFTVAFAHIIVVFVIVQEKNVLIVGPYKNYYSSTMV